MKTRLFVSAVVFLAFAVVAGTAEDPFVGTWKLNVAKSKVTEPSQVLKSCLVKMEAQDNGIKFSAIVLFSNGTRSQNEFRAKYDGKDYPVLKDPEVDTVALTKIDSNTLDYLWKKDGKEEGRWRAVISPNGKAWIVTAQGKNPKGKNYTAVYVSDKQ
jgi:hypothetical protein